MSNYFYVYICFVFTSVYVTMLLRRFIVNRWSSNHLLEMIRRNTWSATNLKDSGFKDLRYESNSLNHRN